MIMNYGPGSTGNIIAAVCSVFVPGLGQLVQGRPFKALFMFATAGLLWFVMLGWLIHIWAIWDAASWYPRNSIRVIEIPATKKVRSEAFYHYQGRDDHVL